jgi:mRNA interferase MazF
VVVSSPEMHDYLRTVIVAPMTTDAQPAAFRIGLTFQGKSGLVRLVSLSTYPNVSSTLICGSVDGQRYTQTLT